MAGARAARLSVWLVGKGESTESALGVRILLERFN